MWVPKQKCEYGTRDAQVKKSLNTFSIKILCKKFGAYNTQQNSVHKFSNPLWLIRLWECAGWPWPSLFECMIRTLSYNTMSTIFCSPVWSTWSFCCHHGHPCSRFLHTALKFFKCLYLNCHLSQSIHIWNLGIWEGLLRFQKNTVCIEVLQPSQPNGVMSSAVSLPNHTFTGQA